MKRNALLLAAVALLTACHTPREVVRVERDSIYITQHVRDSIHTNDSVRIVIGDTITIEHWRTKYVQRWRIDTLMEHHTDTLTRVEVREVEAPLTWWQRKRLQWFPALLAIASLLLLWTFRSPVLNLLRKLIKP